MEIIQILKDQGQISRSEPLRRAHFGK